MRKRVIVLQEAAQQVLHLVQRKVSRLMPLLMRLQELRRVNITRITFLRVNNTNGRFALLMVPPILPQTWSLHWQTILQMR
jgi:hypothetical protein